MTNKRIQDLPLLDENDFNPTTDFVIIQKPSGGTYKIQASKLMSDDEVRQLFFDTKSIDLNYPINSGAHEFSSVLAFEEEGILASNSSFNMEVYLHNLHNGNLVDGGNTALGLKESRTVSKSKGLTTTTIGLSTGATSDWQSFYLAQYTRYGNQGAKIEDISMHYYIKYDFSNANRIALKFYAQTEGAGSGRNLFLPAQQVKIEATITASISS